MEGIPSLLALISEERGFVPGGTLLSRITLVATLSDKLFKRSQLIEEIQQFFEERNIAHSVTGVLLQYTKYCHCILEVPFAEIEGFVRLLHDQQQRGVLEQTCVVHVTDIVSRAFRSWAHREMESGNTKIVEYRTADAPELVASECVTLGSKLGAYLSSKPQSQVQQVLANISEDAPDVLVPQGMLAFLLSAGVLDSVADYVKRYYGGLHIKPDNELVWPLPARLFPYE